MNNRRPVAVEGRDDGWKFGGLEVRRVRGLEGDSKEALGKCLRIKILVTKMCLPTNMDGDAILGGGLPALSNEIDGDVHVF